MNDSSTKVNNSRLIEITLDPKSIGRTNANAEHDREVAIFDLIDDNFFEVVPRDGRVDKGPYKLNIAIAEDRLVLNVSPGSSDSAAADTADAGVGAGNGADGEAQGADVYTFMLSLSPLRRIMKDYFIVCDSYYTAIKNAPPSRIEAIDMGRRGLHDEGSKLLIERLDGKINVDFDTARRLFTLICALHWKG